METLSIDDINKLQAENEMITKQYNSLLKQYNEVLRLAKENADAHEFCLQELERKLQPFQDEYFQGLTEEQIAELAKKSIRVTDEDWVDITLENTKTGHCTSVSKLNDDIYYSLISLIDTDWVYDDEVEE